MKVERGGQLCLGSAVGDRELSKWELLGKQDDEDVFVNHRPRGGWKTVCVTRVPDKLGFRSRANTFIQQSLDLLQLADTLLITAIVSASQSIL